MSEQIDVVSFLALRSATSIVPEISRWRYVRDDDYTPPAKPVVTHVPRTPAAVRVPGRHDVDLFSPDSPSPIGRLLARLIFEQSAPADVIVREVENLLVTGFTYGTDENMVQTRAAIQVMSTVGAIDPARSAKLQYAGSRLTYLREQVLYVLPSSILDLDVPLAAQIVTVGQVLAGLATSPSTDQAPDPAWPADLIAAVAKAAGVSEEQPLFDYVFERNGHYQSVFAGAKRGLFDALYGLYILRRRERVDLEPVQSALAVLHLIERLAIADYFKRAIDAGALPENSEPLLRTVAPPLADVDFSTSEAAERVAALHLLGPASPAELALGLRAEPIIHPLIARLRGSFAPFNTLQPIGLGDLKVVKQTFLGYRKSGIAHIETVLAGETKTRTHRSLQRAEDSYSLSDTSESETTKDVQSTSRFELKAEVEDIVKTDVGVTANTSFTYKGNPVIDASIAAGLSVNASSSSTDRSSRNFVDEVISKAVSRIQTRVATQRSQTRISESEETNVHNFTNTPENGNISGSYLWLDKVYRGQIYNYGRRMMFEFVLPEPAQFYVEARLSSYVAQLPLPPYPTPDENSDAIKKMPIASPAELTEDKFNSLRDEYGLTNETFPPAEINDIDLKALDGGTIITRRDPYALGKPGGTWESTSMKLDPAPAGYDLVAMKVSGHANFANRDEPFSDTQNTLYIELNNVRLFERIDESLMYWQQIEGQGSIYKPVPANMRLGSNVNVSIFGQTCTGHEISVKVSLRRTDAQLAAWQRAIYAAIESKVNAANANAASADLDSRRAEYRKALDALKGAAINEVIAGRSESWNDRQIRRELKRQCVSVVAKEFDAEADDDLLTHNSGIGERSFDPALPRFQVTPGWVQNGVVTQASARYADPDAVAVPFSTIDLSEAAERGRLVQFLEQAFDWQQLSYLFYPYFWARMPMWLQLLDREDPADAVFTEFLQAGAARVLLAVKPGYENAVLHFLATREPWLGGSSPVIGDPLYLPLYEEVRDRQDDLAGAEPVGDSWEFTLPTSLVYLDSERYPLPMEYQPPAGS